METALDDLIKAFEEWRVTRKTKSSRLPEELKERARLLGSHYREQEICARIRYPRYKIFPYMGKPNINKDNFVEIPSLSPPLSTITVEIKSGNHVISVTLPSSINLKDLFLGLRL
jgi:hypothetical protein